MTTTKDLRDALGRAAINCPHSISDDCVNLYHDKTKPGHNALNQLFTRLEEALSAPQASEPITTGHPPGMLQDDDRGLSKWLASKPDARLRAREAAATIGGASSAADCFESIKRHLDGDPSVSAVAIRATCENGLRALAQASEPAPSAPAPWDGKYRGKCADGRRCLQGCYSNDPCRWAPEQPSAAVEASTRGWLAALSEAFHSAKANGATHTAEKLQEVLHHLAAPPEPLRVGALSDEWIYELHREAQDQAITGIAPSRYLARAIEREVLATSAAEVPAVIKPEDWLKALDAAVWALYFDDSSKFRVALGTVIRHLSPVIADDMLCHPKKAFDTVQALIAATSKGAAE